MMSERIPIRRINLRKTDWRIVQKIFQVRRAGTVGGSNGTEIIGHFAGLMARTAVKLPRGLISTFNPVEHAPPPRQIRGKGRP